ETGECPMGVVGRRASDAAPADEASRPVASASRGIAHEGLQGDGRVPLPAAVEVSVVRNARSGAAAGAGQNEQPRMLVDEVGERIVFHYLSALRCSLHSWRVCPQMSTTA